MRGMNYSYRVFEYEGWSYQLVHFDGSDMVRLYFSHLDESVYELGHVKHLPRWDTPVGDVFDTMQAFVEGRISHDEYEQQLPW